MNGRADREFLAVRDCVTLNERSEKSLSSVGLSIKY